MNAKKILQECSQGDFESSNLFKNIVVSSVTGKATAVFYCKDYQGIAFVDNTKERDANIEIFKHSKKSLQFLIELKEKLHDEAGITDLGSALRMSTPELFNYLTEQL